MSAFWGQQFRTAAALVALSLAGTATALAEDGPAPRYTYLGGGYHTADSICAISPSEQTGLDFPSGGGNEGMDGYSAEGSLGLFSLGPITSVHLIGSYFDGDTGSTNVNVKCVEIGAGIAYNFAPGADLVLRGYWVDADSDDVAGSPDGFEPELQVRYMLSERTEADLGLAYYDMDDDSDDFNSTEVRLGLIYNVTPWLALRVAGVIFDDESAFQAGIRGYFGGVNLF